MFHAFWNANPVDLPNQLNNFMKNLSIMGGMLYVIAYGAGPLSLDSRRSAASTASAGNVKPRQRK